MLEAALRARRGGFALDVTLEVRRGETLALVGESGSGKTTVLRLLAGLDRPDAGRVALDGVPWFDAARGIDVPARARDVGLVSQSPALFPHLGVGANVAFGLRARHRPRREAEARAAAALARVGLGGFERRAPRTLSGGQQQRAALARALAPEPRLLLLDEPLAALDLPARRALRVELRPLLADPARATVYVTHDPVEALVLGDRVAVIEDGRIAQTGAPDDLLRHPRTPYVAALLGLNLFRGRLAADGGPMRLVTAHGDVLVAEAAEPGEAFAAVSPRDVTLSLAPPGGSAQNVVRGRVVEIVPEAPYGERVRVAVAGEPPLVAEVTRAAVEALGLREGAEVYASFKATGVSVYR